MKVQKILLLLEQDQLSEELLNEGILDAVQANIQSTKQYFTNVNQGIQAKQNLKNLNGVKTEQNDNIKQAAMDLRTRLQHLYQQATEHIKQLVVQTIQKAKASPITGAYLSRNYYSDYLKYSTILPLFQINKAQVKDKIKDLVADRFVGLALTTLTGIPNIDDIKDIAELSSKAIKAATTMSNNWQQLQRTA